MDVAVTMILIRDVYVVARPDVVADIDREVTHDAAPPPDETTITNSHHRRCHASLTGHHSGRQRAIRTNHGVATDLDVFLVVNGHPRESDERTIAHPFESPPTSGLIVD